MFMREWHGLLKRPGGSNYSRLEITSSPFHTPLQNTIVSLCALNWLARKMAHSAEDTVMTEIACLNFSQPDGSNALDDPFADLNAAEDECGRGRVTGTMQQLIKVISFHFLVYHLMS